MSREGEIWFLRSDCNQLSESSLSRLVSSLLLDPLSFTRVTHLNIANRQTMKSRETSLHELEASLKTGSRQPERGNFWRHFSFNIPISVEHIFFSFSFSFFSFFGFHWFSDSLIRWFTLLFGEWYSLIGCSLVVSAGTHCTPPSVPPPPPLFYYIILHAIRCITSSILYSLQFTAQVDLNSKYQVSKKL